MKAEDWINSLGKVISYGKVEIDTLANSHKIFGKVVVRQAELDLFAAELQSAAAAIKAGEVDANEALTALLASWREAFPSSPGTFLGV